MMSGVARDGVIDYGTITRQARSSPKNLVGVNYHRKSTSP